MQRLPTKLPGLVLLAPTVHGDARGFFMETYRADAWAAQGVPTGFVQDNQSRSRRGTVRGLHFQTHPGQGADGEVGIALLEPSMARSHRGRLGHRSPWETSRPLEEE